MLNSVHSGTDLESAAAAAAGHLSDGVKKQLDQLLPSRQTRGTQRELLPVLTAVREGVKEAMRSSRDDAALRDLLFLDLGLENTLRGMMERDNLSQLSRDGLVERLLWVLRNLGLALDEPELAVCASHWALLLGKPREGRDWALHAKSVADRVSRWLRDFSSRLYQHLQPRAEFLGEAFEADAWTVSLFSEEIVRGSAVFTLSLLLRPLDVLLRQAAGLGGWQVVSPGRAAGRVRVVDRLLAVQGERFQEPVVLIADAVQGVEEIPEGVTAVITTDTPDLVSHVAVRARNAHVLFASCLEPGVYERLKALKDRNVRMQVTPAGDVTYEEVKDAAAFQDKETRRQGDKGTMKPPVALSASWVVTQDQFTADIVGGKSNNLNGLRGRLADWIGLPTSIAVPFGADEKTLADGKNQEIRKEAEALIDAAAQHPSEALARLRELLLTLTAPAGLKEMLLDTWQRAGLTPVPWEQAWTGIRRVWASRWNERATSRAAPGAFLTPACTWRCSFSKWSPPTMPLSFTRPIR